MLNWLAAERAAAMAPGSQPFVCAWSARLMQLPHHHPLCLPLLQELALLPVVTDRGGPAASNPPPPQEAAEEGFEHISHAGERCRLLVLCAVPASEAAVMPCRAQRSAQCRLCGTLTLRPCCPAQSLQTRQAARQKTGTGCCGQWATCLSRSRRPCASARTTRPRWVLCLDVRLTSAFRET